MENMWTGHDIIYVCLFQLINSKMHKIWRIEKSFYDGVLILWQLHVLYIYILELNQCRNWNSTRIALPPPPPTTRVWMPWSWTVWIEAFWYLLKWQNYRGCTTQTFRLGETERHEKFIFSIGNTKKLIFPFQISTKEAIKNSCGCLGYRKDSNSSHSSHSDLTCGQSWKHWLYAC